MLIRLVALTTCLFVVSCASTQMTSFRDPSAPDADFKTIFVVVAFSDLETRVIAEDAFVARLENFGIRGIPSYTVIPPPREYTSRRICRETDPSFPPQNVSAAMHGAPTGPTTGPAGDLRLVYT